MARVLVTARLPEGALDPLSPTHEMVGPPDPGRQLAPTELRDLAADVDAIVCLLTDRIDREILSAGSGRLRIVANVAVGYDNVDVDAARELGVAVANTPGVLDETTADTAWLLILAASRLAHDAEAELRAGRWSGWSLDSHVGRDVHGASLGLVGYGRIGRAVARRAAGFGMQVRHHARHDTGEHGYTASLDDLVSDSDIVSLHVPGGAETHHLFDADRLARMKPTSVLVNTSRGTVVDEEALAASLERGDIFAAGLDVFENEPEIHPRLLAAPHTVLLPHIGSASAATRLAMARLATSTVESYLSGGSPPTLITSPRR